MSVDRLDGAGDRPYVPGVVAEGRFVFVSGQVPVRSGQLVRGPIEEQTAAVLENVAAVLRLAGASLDDVVRCGVFLADLDQLPAFNEAYVRVFGPRPPARTTAGVHLPGYDVEIDCIAVLPHR